MHTGRENLQRIVAPEIATPVTQSLVRNDINLMTLPDFRWTCLTVPFFIYLFCNGFGDSKKQHPEEFPSAVIYEDVFYC